MSTLRGRYFIDRSKRWALNAFNWSLPVPPYGSPEFWDRSYRDFSPFDPPQEWANLDHSTLHSYQYRLLNKPQQQTSLQTSSSSETTLDASHQDKPLHSTTLVETLGLGPATTSCTENDKDVDDNQIAETGNPTKRSSPHYNDQDDQPMLMLGCGNSRMAVDMWHTGQYKGPMIQVDISSRIVEIMSTWCSKEIRNGDMFVVQDDATELSSLSRDNSVSAALDKGLIDALFCASLPNDDKVEACWKVLCSVHRVLQPHGCFCFYSYSQPGFVLPALQQPRRGMWSDVQVRHDVTNGILLYRFQKEDPERKEQQLHQKQPKRHKNSHYNKRHSRHRRR